jgi:CheY-like chemotaxis protein
MERALPAALIAAPAAVIKELGSVLADDVARIGVETFDDAVATVKEGRPDVLIVCYAFDEVRPFRLLQHLRQESRGGHVPTMLVRALPIPIGEAEEARIREAYTTLGVDQFFNLNDEARRTDRAAALQKFRGAVRALLPRRPSKGNPDIAEGRAGVE